MQNKHAQQRAKEYALEYENSKLSQLQPEPEREPDAGQMVNVLDDDTMAELLFQEIDVDGSGTLDWGEIDALAKQLGKPLSEEELTAAMKEMDEDGNGTPIQCVLCLSGHCLQLTANVNVLHRHR